MKKPIIDQHRGHPKRIVAGPFGPHQAKMECVLCRAFVKWVPKNYKEPAK
jgi:hypothetical protein